MLQTSDGGFIVIGTTHSFGDGNSDAWLTKTDSNGVEEWNQTFGAYGFESANCIIETDTRGYIFVGRKRPLFDDYGDPTRVIAIDQQQGELDNLCTMSDIRPIHLFPLLLRYVNSGEHLDTVAY